MLLNKMNTKAIVVYVDNVDKIIIEFSWLWKSWQLYSLNEEYDLVVYYHPDVEEKLKEFTDIVKIPMKPIRLSSVYPFLNSHYFCLDEWSEPLKRYDYIMKTDCDVFLTKNLKGYTPSKIHVGMGLYYLPNEIKKIEYLQYLSKELNLNYKFLTLIGTSFFGESKDIINIVKGQISITEAILEKYSKEERFIECGFDRGISSMIAGELVINHMCSNQHIILYNLDGLCWETTPLGTNILHIHAWHTFEKWSKFHFHENKYNDWIVDFKDAFSNCANYCQFIATLSFEKMFEYKQLLKQINY